jgi:UDP-N-acetylglucosamine transferase subunit ALG13
MKCVVALLLICLPLAYAQGFDPDSLTGTVIEHVAPCGDFSCLTMTKDGKKYIVVVNEKREAQYVFLIESHEEKVSVRLIWSLAST